MTKILVTGMTSTHCNPARADKEVTVASLIATALRELGFEVEHRNPDFTEDLSGFDHVFCGVSAPHAVGANRIYGALGVILRGMADNKVTLFVDDADVPKIGGGLRTMVNNPERFTKQFFQYRPQWELACEPMWREWLFSGVKILNENAWPTTLLPLFPWADLAPWQRKLPNAAHALVPVDFTKFITDFGFSLPGERMHTWVSEAPHDSRWYRTVRPVFPVQRYGSVKRGFDRRPDDKELVERYTHVWGVIDEPTQDGWWTSRIGYAAQARSLYVTKWQAVERLGEAYGVLADVAAGWDQDSRSAWAAVQAESLDNVSTPKDVVFDQLLTLTGKPKAKAASGRKSKRSASA